MKRIMLWLCLALGLIPLHGLADSYLYSMLPLYLPNKMNKLIPPMAEYLGKATGLAISPLLTDNFADYEAKVRSGQIAIGYQNPVIVSRLGDVHQVLATAVDKKEGDKFRGILITRRGSDIKSFADLKGKQVMIVGKTSAAGYLSQKLSLKEIGLDAEKDLKLEVAAENKQENVIIAVSIGEVDAGFINESALHTADAYIQPNSILSVANGTWLPNWGLSVSRSLPEAQRETIRTAVLNLKENDAVMIELGLKSFRVAHDAEYALLAGETK